MPEKPEILDYERPAGNPHRPPMNPQTGPHRFVLSEFPEGAALGYCDVCGGGELHSVHLGARVEPLAEIADALQRLAAVAESWNEDRISAARRDHAKRTQVYIPWSVRLRLWLRGWFRW